MSQALNKMKLILVFLVFSLAVANCYKILGLSPFGSKSHYAIGEAVMKALHEAGHEVTMISVFELKKPLPNYNHVKISDWFGEKMAKEGSSSKIR